MSFEHVLGAALFFAPVLHVHEDLVDSSDGGVQANSVHLHGLVFAAIDFAALLLGALRHASVAGQEVEGGVAVLADVGVPDFGGVVVGVVARADLREAVLGDQLHAQHRVAIQGGAGVQAAAAETNRAFVVGGGAQERVGDEDGMSRYARLDVAHVRVRAVAVLAAGLFVSAVIRKRVVGTVSVAVVLIRDMPNVVTVADSGR